MRAPSSQRIVDSPAVVDGLRVDGVGVGDGIRAVVEPGLVVSQLRVQCVEL